MIEDKVFERIGYIRKTKHFSMYRLAKEADIPYYSLNNIFTDVPALQSQLLKNFAKD